MDLPGASYNLTTDEKRAVYQWLRAVKVSTDFSSNIKSLVSMKGLTLTSFNAHDCHIMLTVFLPIMIRAIGPAYVKMVMTCLSYSFSFITQKVIDEAKLPDMKQFIAETLCQLEMCFPPSFFDIMPHQMMHTWLIRLRPCDAVAGTLLIPHIPSCSRYQLLYSIYPYEHINVWADVLSMGY